MADRPSTLLAQSLLLLLTLLIGVFIGGVIGYLLGVSRVETVSVVTATTVVQLPIVVTQETQAIRPTLTTQTILVTPLSPTAEQSTAVDVTEVIIPLPEVVTFTATPSTFSTFDMSEDQANAVVAHAITKAPELSFLSEPSITIVDGILELRATSNDPTGRFGKGLLVVRGRPEVSGVRVVFKIDSAEIGGQAVPDSFYPAIEGIFNETLREVIGEKPAHSVEVLGNLLRITVTDLQ